MNFAKVMKVENHDKKLRFFPGNFLRYSVLSSAEGQTAALQTRAVLKLFHVVSLDTENGS